MNQNRFAAVTQWMTQGPSRRHVLRGLAAAGLGLGFARLPDLVEGKKKRKRKKRKKGKPQARPNQYGCLEVNDPCTSADQCCSGICEGKKCRAHGTDICRQDRSGVCTADLADVPSLGCGTNCYCFRTTAGSNFCGPSPRTSGQEDCTTCQKDADCLALGYPPGSACAPVGRGNCTSFCGTGMACLVPCGAEFPPPPAG